jgi:hypothetical protein
MREHLRKFLSPQLIRLSRKRKVALGTFFLNFKHSFSRKPPFAFATLKMSHVRGNETFKNLEAAAIYLTRMNLVCRLFPKLWAKHSFQSSSSLIALNTVYPKRGRLSSLTGISRDLSASPGSIRKTTWVFSSTPVLQPTTWITRCRGMKMQLNGECEPVLNLFRIGIILNFKLYLLNQTMYKRMGLNRLLVEWTEFSENTLGFFVLSGLQLWFGRALMAICFSCARASFNIF